MPILNWLTRDEDIQRASRAPYRLLEEVPALSYGDADTGHMLIQGDNLDALKALLPYYGGKVKCIFIDPPYNTKSAFEHYDDNMEHSQWLAMIYPRLELLWELLSNDDGIILISINDDEGHYLKVVCDEIFGRTNFMAALVWNYEGNTDNQAKIINYHEYILVYSKSGKLPNPKVIDPNIGLTSKLRKPEIRNTIVKNGPKNPLGTIEIPCGFPVAFEAGTIRRSAVRYPEYSDDIHVENYTTKNSVYARTGWSSRTIFEKFIQDGFKPVKDSKGQETIFELTRSGAVEAVKNRKQEKGHFLSVLRGFGTTNQMRLMLEQLQIKFTFPKPINLIAYLVEAFTDEDSVVLDSFAGSGTTAHAVLKLNAERSENRCVIVIEIERDTAENVIVPRLKAVIDGDTRADLPVCGGGFRFYRLGDQVFDEAGHVSANIQFSTLAAHLWFAETGHPLVGRATGSFLGEHEGTGYYLLFNGILGDKRPDGGNILTSRILTQLPPFMGPKVIFGEGCRMGSERLAQERITFRHIPYEISAR